MRAVISGLLILLSIGLNLQHGWAELSAGYPPPPTTFLATLDLPGPFRYGLGLLNWVAAGLLLFPQTFLAGNLINAGVLLVIMTLAARSGHYRTVLLEIPFLLLPLVLGLLKPPLAK